MPNDLQLSDQDEVLLESLVLAASDNVARAPASDRDQYAPERRRAFVETSGAGNVYLGTGSAWVDVSENTGLLSSLFGGGDGNFDSVNTDEAFSEYQPNSGLSSWASDTPQSRKQTLSLSVEPADDNPKLPISEIDWSAASVSDPTDIHWPTVINTTELADSRGDNHCYFAPHDTDGIGMAYFDDPMGEWSKINGPILESGYGEVGGFVKDGEVNLYSCRPNNQWRLLRSSDGETGWTDNGVVLDTADIGGGGHAGYPRPIHTPDGVAVHSFWKASNDMATQGLHLSPDGNSEWDHLAVGWHNRQRPTGVFAVRWLHVAPVPCDPLNGYLCFYAEEDDTGSDRTGDIRWGWTRNGLTIHDVGVAIAGDEQSWSGGLVGDPQPFWWDGRLYLAYSGRPVQSNNPADLAVAEVQLEAKA
jgi:hypothetical protein